MYKINNISLESYGIITGQINGESIAIKGIFDLPKRIGETHHSWDEIDSVEPFVDFGQVLLGGRTILFAGLILDTKIGVETKLQAFRTAIAAFTDVVRFETPYGSACVIIKKITPKIYNEGASVIIEFREPVAGASCPILGNVTTYYSAEYSENADKNDCASGYYGSTETITAEAGKFTSTYSQQAADQLAIDWVKENKQLYANSTGTCIVNPTTYYNVKLTGQLQKNNCDAGYVGSLISYKVAAFKYSSLISQADADAKAQAELDTILTQSYANTNGICIMNPTFVETWNNVQSNSFRAQQFTVGESIIDGTTYNLMVYSHQISYTSVLGDTPSSIVQALVTAIDNTTEAQWNDENSAPLSGTFAFPPNATAYSNIPNVLSVTLNKQNQFAAWIS
jgi:Family of unknown function (DUF5977)